MHYVVCPILIIYSLFENGQDFLDIFHYFTLALPDLRGGVVEVARPLPRPPDTRQEQGLDRI